MRFMSPAIVSRITAATMKPGMIEDSHQMSRRIRRISRLYGLNHLGSILTA